MADFAHSLQMLPSRVMDLGTLDCFEYGCVRLAAVTNPVISVGWCCQVSSANHERQDMIPSGQAPPSESLFTVVAADTPAVFVHGFGEQALASGIWCSRDAV